MFKGMGGHCAYTLCLCLLSLLYTQGVEEADHYWSFDKADTISMIKDEITNTKADLANTTGNGNFFTSFTSGDTAAPAKKYLTMRGKKLKINLGSYPECIGNITNCKRGFTLSLWLRHRATTKQQYLITSSVNHVTNPFTGMTIFLKQNVLVFTISHQKILHSFSYKSKESQWDQHTFLWNGTTIMIFVNGKRIKAEYNAQVINRKDISVISGFNLGGGENKIDADFNEISIWHRQLSASTIEKMYKSTIDYVVISTKCQVNVSSVCVAWNSREDYYQLIVSEELMYKRKGSKQTSKINIELNQQKRCIPNLEALSDYQVTVVTQLTDGRIRESNTVTCKTIDGVPNSPSALDLKVSSSTELLASWKKPLPSNGVITNYVLDLFQVSEKKNLKLIKTQKIPSSSDKMKINLNDLKPGTKYQVSIASIGNLGKGKSISETAVLFIEEMVTNVRLDKVSDNTIVVTWDKSRNPKTYTPRIHRVYYGRYDQSRRRYVDTNKTSVSLAGLQPSTIYFINVAAYLKQKYIQLLDKDITVKTKDRNECLYPMENTCDSMAKCINTEKTYICNCPAGYYGDGYICKKIPSFALETFYCHEETFRNLQWPKTFGGDEAKLPCPVGVSGYATRKCLEATIHSPAKYVAPDLSKCVTKSVRDLEYQLLDATTTGLFVLGHTNNVMKSIDPYGGDIIETLAYAKHVLTKKFPGNNTPDVKYIGESLTLLTSLLLDTKSTQAWYDIPQRDRRKTAEKLLSIMEQGAVKIINSIDEDYFLATENNTMIKVQKRMNEASVMMSTSADNNTLGYMIQIPYNASNMAGGLSAPLVLSKYNNIGSFLLEPHGNISVSPSVMSATFVGKKMNFKNPVVIRVPHPKGYDVSNPSCVFWDKSARNGSGAWLTDGCIVHNSSKGHTICYCYHMTNFAVLMTLTAAGINNIVFGQHAYSLKIITYFGLIVSIIALIAALLTFIIFRFLKSKRIVCHSHLVLALLLASITFLCGIESTGNKSTCQVVAVLLEYFYLVAFFWMAVEGMLLYLMLRKVFKDIKLFKQRAFHVACWILPAVYVMVMFGLFPQQYGTESYCWLSISGAFIWSFIVPVLLVIVFNVCIMILAFRIMATRNREKEDSAAREIWYWLKGSFILMFILGVTWVFGLLHLGASSIAFAYIFCFLNAFQGLFIFIFHCLIDPKVRNEYIRILKCQARSVYNEKNHSLNSTRYLKLSTTTEKAKAASLLDHQNEFYSINDYIPSAQDEDVFTERKASQTIGLSKERKPTERMDEFTEIKPSQSTEVFIERKTSQKTIHTNSIEDNNYTNSLEDLLDAVENNTTKGTVVDIPETEYVLMAHQDLPPAQTATCLQHTTDVRQSLILEQRIKNGDEDPWRYSIFDRIDDERNEVEYHEFSLFSRQLSEKKDDTMIDVYDSSEILTPPKVKRDTVIEVVPKNVEKYKPIEDDREIYPGTTSKPLHVQGPSVDPKGTLCGYAETPIVPCVHDEVETCPFDLEVDGTEEPLSSHSIEDNYSCDEEMMRTPSLRDPVYHAVNENHWNEEITDDLAINIEDNHQLTVNIDDNNVLTLNIEDNVILAVSVKEGNISDSCSEGSKLSLTLDDTTEIVFEHNRSLDEFEPNRSLDEFPQSSSSSLREELTDEDLKAEVNEIMNLTGNILRYSDEESCYLPNDDDDEELERQVNEIMKPDRDVLQNADEQSLDLSCEALDLPGEDDEDLERQVKEILNPIRDPIREPVQSVDEQSIDFCCEDDEELERQVNEIMNPTRDLLQNVDEQSLDLPCQDGKEGEKLSTGKADIKEQRNDLNEDLHGEGVTDAGVNFPDKSSLTDIPHETFPPDLTTEINSSDNVRLPTSPGIISDPSVDFDIMVSVSGEGNIPENTVPSSSSTIISDPGPESNDVQLPSSPGYISLPPFDFDIKDDVPEEITPKENYACKSRLPDKKSPKSSSHPSRGIIVESYVPDDILPRKKNKKVVSSNIPDDILPYETNKNKPTENILFESSVPGNILPIKPIENTFVENSGPDNTLPSITEYQLPGINPKEEDFPDVSVPSQSTGDQCSDIMPNQEIITDENMPWDYFTTTPNDDITPIEEDIAPNKDNSVNVGAQDDVPLLTVKEEPDLDVTPNEDNSVKVSAPYHVTLPNIKEEAGARITPNEDIPSPITIATQFPEMTPIKQQDDESVKSPRMSIHSTILHDIGDIMATIPPKMESAAPLHRDRIKTKMRKKPAPLSFDYFSSDSDDQRKESIPENPIDTADLELFKDIEDAIENDRQEALNRSKSPHKNTSPNKSPTTKETDQGQKTKPINIGSSRLSPDSDKSPASRSPHSPRTPSSPTFRCEMEILQFQPGRYLIGSPTHTVLKEMSSSSDEEETRI